MKQHSGHSGTCSCTSCVYQSQSSRPSVQHLIEDGSRIDRLYYGKYLPLRERKLLEKLIRTRAVYDDVRTELLSSGSSETRSDYKIKRRDDDIADKSSAVIEIVDLVDRGQIGSTNSSRLSSCCSCCECASLKKIKKHMEKHPPRVHRHHVPYEEIAKYTVEAEKRGRKSRQRLTTKISSKVRTVRFKAKQIRSAPISSRIKRSSTTFVHERMAANAQAQKISVDPRTIGKKICNCSCRFAKIPMKSFQKIKSMRKSSIKSSGTENADQKNFNIRKDSLTLFREKQDKQQTLEEYECPPGICDMDDHGVCIPEECLEKIKRLKNLTPLVGANLKKYHHRISGARRDQGRVSISTRPRKIKQTRSQVQTTTTTKSKSPAPVKGLKSVSSMTSSSKTKSVLSKEVTVQKKKNKSKGQKLKATETQENEYIETDRTLSNSLQEKQKNYKTDLKKTKAKKSSPKSKLAHVICECKPLNKTTSSMTDTEVSKIKSSKRKREKTFKIGRKSKRDIHREHRTTEHSIQSHEIHTRELDEEETGEPVKKAVKISSSFRFEIEFSKKQYPTLTEKEIVDHVKSKRQRRLKRKYRARSSQESQASYLRETASQTTRACESSICMAQECPATCTQVSMPYQCNPETCTQLFMPHECTNENCTYTPKARRRTTMSSTDRIRRKSAGSATSTFQTSSRSKYIQSKSMESFMTKPEKKTRKIPPRQILEQNVHDDSSHPDKQAVRIGSSFSFSIEFYKENSPKFETEEVQEIPYKRREKRKQTSYRPKHKDRGHQPRYTNFQHTSSQSRSSQSAKNIQAGHRLKRCFCTLKLMQKKKGKIRHAASKKTMANFRNNDNKKVAWIRQTQTKSPGITYHIPPDTSRLLPYECEPSFCTPGECNPYECAERIKQRNRKKNIHHIETNTFDTAKKSAPTITSQSVSSSTQSDEYMKKKQKRKRLNTPKNETEVLPDKPEKQAVRVGSSFTFNIEFSKENKGRQEGTYDKAPVIFSESNKPTQMERKRKQQKGIKVHKPRVQHVTSETDRNVKENETNTAPFLQRCFCTLKLFNKKKTKTLPPNRNKNDFVVQMQNRSITTNRAHSQYHCDPYECEKYNDMHDMLSFANDFASTYSETSPTYISSRTAQPYSKTQRYIEEKNKEEDIYVGSATKNCFCTLKLEKKGKSKIPNSQICDCKSTNISHRSPSPQNMCECKSIKTVYPLPSQICECTSTKKSKLVFEDMPNRETRETSPTNISSRSRHTQSYSKTQKLKAKQIEDTHRQFNNLDLPPSQTNRQAVRISSSFSFDVEFYKENISDGKQVLQDQDTKPKLKPTSSQQLTLSRSQKTTIEVKNKEKGINAGSAIKRCFCTLKLQKKGTSKIPISQICDCKSTNTSHQSPSPQNMCECKSTKTIYPLPSQICECKSTSTKKSKLVYEIVPDTSTSRICDPYECKRLYDHYTNTEKRRKKSVMNVTPTEFSGSSKRKITKSKFKKCPCDKDSVMMKDIRPKSSISSSRQAVCLSSNFSFDIEFFKECFATPVQDSKHKAAKYYTVNDISAGKHNRDRGVIGKQVVSKHRRLQASNIVKKENKGSNVGVLLKRCFCTLGLQKKGDLKTEHPVTCFCRNQPITTQFVQVLHMGLNKSRNAVYSNTNEKHVLESQDIIKSRHSATNKTWYKNETIRLKSQEDYNCLDKKVFDVKQKNRGNRISLKGTRLLSREVITRSFSKNTIRPRFGLNIDIKNEKRPAMNIIDKSKDNLLLHSLRSDIKKKSPFYQSFYALNLQVSNHHSRILEPNECEPGFCVPYQCDPVECLKRINSRYKRSQLSGTVAPKSKCETCFTNRLQSKSSGEHFEKHKQQTSSKNAHVIQESPHPSRRSFNLGSNFSVALEFFKNTPHTSDGMTMTDKLRQAKDAATKCLRSKFQQAHSQINIKHRDKSIGTTPLLKRCFCTLKLMNNKYDNATMLKHKDTMANKPFGDVIYNIHRKVMTDKLLPYECAPNVCVPGECDAIECYKRIQERLKKQRKQAIGTDNPRHKSTLSFPKKKHIVTGTIRPKTKQIDRKKIIKASQNRNVRFGSNISFNVEFFRDTANRSHSTNNEPVKQSSGRTYRNSQVPPRGSGDNRNRHPDPEIRETRNSVAHMLGKCFCALKLARKRRKPTEKPKKGKQKKISFTKRSVHNKNQKKSKVEKAKKTPRVKSAVINKGTAIKENPISKSFDCEPYICKRNTLDENSQNLHQNEKRSSDFNNLMHKCICKLTRKGKTLVPKPSIAQIIRVNSKGKLTHSNPSNPMLEKKRNTNKNAVDENREMETIMPYSKKKFNRQESITKVTQKTATLRSSKRTKKQAKKKSKNSCLCEICDCDQAQDQDLCKCNITGVKAEDQNVGKKSKPKKQKKPAISNQEQSNLVSDQQSQDDKDAKSKKRSKNQKKKKENNSCLCEICNCDNQDQDLCKCNNTASIKSEHQKVGKQSKPKKQKNPAVSHQEPSSLVSDEQAQDDKDAKSKKGTKKQNKKQQNNSCLCEICNCDNQDQGLCKCNNTASIKVEHQKVGKQSKSKKQKKPAVSHQEPSSLAFYEQTQDASSASTKRSTKQNKKKQNNSCLCEICNCDKQDQGLCKCNNTANIKVEHQKVGKQSKSKKQKNPAVSHREPSSLASYEQTQDATSTSTKRNKKQNKKKQNNSCLCEICNCDKQDQGLCNCNNAASIKIEHQKVGKQSKSKKQKKPAVSHQEPSSLASYEQTQDAITTSIKRSKKQNKKKQNNSCLCEICNCDKQDQGLCNCNNTASIKVEHQKVGKQSKSKKHKNPAVSHQEPSSLASYEQTQDAISTSIKHSKKQNKKKQNNSCLCEICNCDKHDQGLCKCNNTASIKVEHQKVGKQSKSKKQKKPAVSHQEPSSLASYEQTQDATSASIKPSKNQNKKTPNNSCLCETCSCFQQAQDVNNQEVGKQSKAKKQKKPKSLKELESSLISSEEVCDLCPDCKAAKRKKQKSTKKSSLDTNTDDCDLCPECRAANLKINKRNQSILDLDTKLKKGGQSKNTELSCPCCKKTCIYQSRPRYISSAHPPTPPPPTSPPSTPPPPTSPPSTPPPPQSLSKIIKVLIDKVSGFSNCMKKAPPPPPTPKPQINNTPMFNVLVNKSDMNIMNKKEVLKNLGSRGKPETEVMMKAREGAQNGTIAPPVMEVLVDKYNANIINSEEIFRNIVPHEKRQKGKRKSRKRSKGICLRCASQRGADSYKSAPIMYTNSVRTGPSANHDVGCNCCICRGKRSSVGKKNKGAGDSKSIKSKSKHTAKKAKGVQSEVVPGGVPRGRPGSSLLARLPTSKFKSVLHHHAHEKPDLLTFKFKPCVCGSTPCKLNMETMKNDAKQLRKIKVKKCVCGSKICQTETAKLPALLVKAAKKQQRAKEKQRIKIYKEQQYQKDRLIRKERYAVEDARRWQQRKKNDKRDMKSVVKYEESTPDVLKVTGSILDIAKLSCRAFSDVIKCASRIIRHPKDGIYNVKDMIDRPEKAVKSAATACKETGVAPIMSRVKRRILGITLTRRAIKTLESYAWTNFIIHINDKDPSKRFNRLKQKREREQLDFGCSLFMATLRKRPFLKVYNCCPWFYPHFVNFLGLIRQFIDIGLFILAVGVWSPCILIMELCRAMMCCCLCTA